MKASEKLSEDEFLDSLFHGVNDDLDGPQEARGNWTDRRGKVMKMSEMTLGHLKASINMMATKLEQAKTQHASNVQWIEDKLGELTSEYDSRDKEIDQMLGILGALQRGAQREGQ